MTQFPRELLERIMAAPVPRAEIAKALGTTASVSMILSQKARHLPQPHVVERRFDPETGKIQYLLRVAAAGEMAGIVTEARGPRAREGA